MVSPMLASAPEPSHCRHEPGKPPASAPGDGPPRVLGHWMGACIGCLFACCAWASYAQAGTRAVSPIIVQTIPDSSTELLRAIRAHGGFILFTRHADRIGRADRLSDEGIRRATAWARELRRLAVVQGRDIVAADTKRTRDTAALLGGDSIQTSAEINEVYRAEQEPALAPAEQVGDSLRVENLRRLLLAAPPAGRNRMIVGSTNIFHRATGFAPLAPLETSILQQDKRGGLVELGKIDAEAFARVR